jgi:hypothetical protein
MATTATLKKKLDGFSLELLAGEMKRFLPERYRRLLEKNGYDAVRASANQVLDEALRAVVEK